MSAPIDRLPSGNTRTAKQNYTAIVYGNEKGSVGFGHIHEKGDVTSGVSLRTPEAKHHMLFEIDGPRKGYTQLCQPGNLSINAGLANTEAAETISVVSENGNISITATNGKIRLQGTDIELVAICEGGAKGHIKCTATETFTVHETKKIILDSKALTKITTTGIMSIAANSCLKIYSSIIRGVTDACAKKDSKTGGQRFQKENNQV